MFPIGQFSPDGKVFSGMFKLLSVDDPKKVLLPDRKRLSFNPGVFSPDGKWLAFVEFERDRSTKWRVGTYDLDMGKRILDFPFPSDAQVAFSPDGKTLAVAGAKWLVFHDAMTGKEYARWKTPFASASDEHNSFARAVRFTPDGKRVITAHDDTAPLVWTVPQRPAE